MLGLQLEQGFQKRPGLGEVALLQERHDRGHRWCLRGRRLPDQLDEAGCEHHRQLTTHRRIGALEIVGHCLVEGLSAGRAAPLRQQRIVKAGSSKARNLMNRLKGRRPRYLWAPEEAPRPEATKDLALDAAGMPTTAWWITLCQRIHARKSKAVDVS